MCTANLKNAIKLLSAREKDKHALNRVSQFTETSHVKYSYKQGGLITETKSKGLITNYIH